MKKIWSHINKDLFYSLFFSVLTFFGILYYSNALFSENSFNIIYIFIFLILIWFYMNIHLSLDNRTKSFSIITAVIISFILVVGNKVYKSMNNLDSIFNLINSFELLISIIGLSLLFYRIFGMVFSNLNKFKIFNKEKQSLKIKWFLFIVLAMVICWIPYFIRFYPGILTYDSYIVLDMVRFDVFDDHHSFGYIFVFGLIWKLGMFIFDNMINATAFFTIIQMFFMAFVFTFCIKYLYERGLKKSFCIILFVCFALSPLHAYYSITLWKDVVFGCMILLLTISVFELIRTDFKPKIRYIFLFIISTLGVLFFRNNGIYIYILLVPFLILITKYNKILFRCLYILLLGIYFIVKGPIYDMIGVNPTATVESFSIPLQQIARTLVVENNIKEKDLKTIKKYINVSEIRESYSSYISDPIKGITYNDKLNKNKIDFIKIWFKLLLKYPDDYLEAYFLQTLGYWYPNVRYWSVGSLSPKSSEHKDIYNTYTSNNFFTKLIDFTASKKLPFSILVWSVGLQFIILLFATLVVIYFKKYKLLMVYIPSWALWLSIMVATPVFCELRYVYGLFVTVPFLIVISFFKFNKDFRFRSKKNTKNSRKHIG